jgi:hypothetical protein
MTSLNLDALIENIQNSDHAIRAAARDAAGVIGAQAVAPLARIAASGDIDTSRAAVRAMENIVYHAGRPGAEDEAKDVAGELVRLLGASLPLQLRRDLLWMTWQIAGEEAVDPVAALLTDKPLHEDARMALERLPGERATIALSVAFEHASDAERPALAHSLRMRGAATPGVPDLRLKPTKETSVQPVGR